MTNADSKIDVACDKIRASGTKLNYCSVRQILG